MPNFEDFKYKAFISYSHKDEKWASWLHKALETYKVPKHLVGQPTEFGPVPERIAPIFRDREELSTSTSLGDVLTTALKNSACQIVICSPHAAKSRWTNEEILTYKRLGRSDRVFCLIVDGEPGASIGTETPDLECFPEALKYEVDDEGNITGNRSEPIAADARKGKDNKHNAKLKLIAGMLGVDFDALRQREAQRRHRRMAFLTAAAVVGMAITSALAASAWFARLEAEAQRNRAQIEAETARQTTQFMVDLFKVSDPSEALGNTITAREILDKGAEKIDTELANQPEIQATLMDTMGTVYKSLALYDRAADLVIKATNKRREIFGDLHPEVAQSQTHLGEILNLEGDYDAAEVQLREALQKRLELHGKNSLEAAETMTMLGKVLHRKGIYDEAGKLFVSSLDIRRAHYETEHEDIAENLEDLGVNDYEQGNYEQAVDYLKQALDMRRNVHDGAHPELAETMNNLAWAWVDLGDLAAAETLFREALAMKIAMLGEQHTEVGVAMNNMARVLEMRGDLEGAEAAYRHAIDIYQRIFKGPHPEIAVSTSNLAYVMYAQGKIDAAIETQRGALNMQRGLVGSEHPSTAGLAASLAYWLSEEGEYAEAEALINESIAVRRKLLGNDHPQTAGALTVYANILLETGHYHQALSAVREARDILIQSLPETHWRVAAAKHVEGRALAGIGEFAMAEPILLASLDGLAQAPIPNLAEAGRSNMVKFYAAWGREEEAAKFR